VLLVSGSGNVTIGTPLVDGARVIAEVVEHGRDKKISVFKYKNKTRYRRRRGHRQDYTRLAIRGILAAGEEAPAEEETKPKRPARKRPAPKVTVGAVATAEGHEAASAEIQAPTVEAKPKPRAPRRAAKMAEASTEMKPATRRKRPAVVQATTEVKPSTKRKKSAEVDTSGE
jgi:large subunit ribosomal protein L21